MRSIEWWNFQWPWWTPSRFSRSRHFWSRISEKTARLKDKVTIAPEEKYLWYYVWWPWLTSKRRRGGLSASAELLVYMRDA